MRIAMLCPKCEEAHYAERCPTCGHGEVVELPQYVGGWWRIRAGVPTASCFKKILTAKDARLSASANKYIAELLKDQQELTPPFFSERDTGRPLSAAIKRGQDFEQEACDWYRMERDVDIRRIGFCTTDDGRFGCSPDLLAGEDGGCEIKVDEPETHLENLLYAPTLPLDHKAQVHGCLIVTGRAWWDYLAYYPEKPHLSILIRVTPDEYTDKLRAALDGFWAKYQAARARLAELNGLAEGEILEPAF